MRPIFVVMTRLLRAEDLLPRRYGLRAATRHRREVQRAVENYGGGVWDRCRSVPSAGTASVRRDDRELVRGADRHAHPGGLRRAGDGRSRVRAVEPRAAV